MTEAEIQIQVADALRQLPVVAQMSVLQFARSLRQERPNGVPGKELLRFAGTLSAEEAEQFLKTIEETCEQVHPDDWKFPA